jgi:phage shock protein C
LFTTVNKTLAIFTILFFILLPLVGIIIWLIRKIAGYNKPNRPLRIIFTGLNILGWVSIVFLIANLARENNTYVSKPIRQNIAITSDTLFVQPMTPDSAYSENVVFQLNQFDRILEKSATENKIKAVRLKYKKTDDTTFTIEIEKSAFGKNRQVASDNAMLASYETSLVGNTLYLPSMLSVRNTLPYHFQNVKVTIYVPKNKTLIISENLKKQLSHSIRTNHKNFEYHYESWNETDIDEIIRFDGSDNNIIRINDKTITIDDGSDDDKREAKEILNEAQRDAQQQIDEAKRELEQSNNDAKRQLDEAQREAQLKIDEAKRNLEESKREAQRKIEEAKRSSNK